MLELVTLSVFSAILLVCILLDYSILLALLIGYFIFCTYGLIKKFKVPQLIKMSWDGIKTVKNILITFLLIGMITGIWRACGTIAFIIYHSSGFVVPSAFILVTFLLCCLISTLTGTAFGSVATVGVICMTLANAMEINTVFVGGAVLSGIYFGDRCSPMSTSALLVSELTKTDIYRNIKNMIHTAIVPFLISCALYLLLGISQTQTDISLEVWRVFANNFNLHWITVLPAVLIVALCIMRVKVKIAMLVSIAAGSAICLLLQHTDLLNLLRLLLLGYQSPDPQLAAMMDGGGVISMIRVAAIVCLSSSFAGIFDGTGLLDGIKEGIASLSNRITAYGSLVVTSVVTSMVACNQTLSIMLTHHLCKDTISEPEDLAVNLENTVVVIAPLIPWSIACAVPLAAVNAPNSAILAAFYLYLLPVWNLFYKGKHRKNKQLEPLQ